MKLHVKRAGAIVPGLMLVLTLAGATGASVSGERGSPAVDAQAEPILLVRAPAGFVDITEYEFISPGDEEYLSIAFQLLPGGAEGSANGPPADMAPASIVEIMREDLREGMGAEIALEEDVLVQGLAMRRLDFTVPGADAYGRLLVGPIDAQRHVHVFHMVSNVGDGWSRLDAVQSGIGTRPGEPGTPQPGSLLYDLGPVSVQVPAGLVPRIVFEFHRVEDDIDLLVDPYSSEPTTQGWLASLSQLGELTGVEQSTRDGAAGTVERITATVADPRYDAPRSICLVAATGPDADVVMILGYGPDSAAARVHGGCDDVVAQIEGQARR